MCVVATEEVPITRRDNTVGYDAIGGDHRPAGVREPHYPPNWTESRTFTPTFRFVAVGTGIRIVCSDVAFRGCGHDDGSAYPADDCPLENAED